jgi:hypothetical protein
VKDVGLWVASPTPTGARQITFDVRAAQLIGSQYGWQNWYDTFCICRRCGHATKCRLRACPQGWDAQEGVLNNYLDVEDYVSLKDQATVAPPQYIPKEIEAVFKEGETCLAVGCHNAAGTMFRLCVDLATRSMLPKEDAEGLNARVRRDLGPRLPWLFANKLFPESSRTFHPASMRTATMALMPVR